MPPEHDDYRERQLAALRRYVSDLDVRRQHNGDQLRPAEGRRPTARPWLLVTLLLMSVSLAGGIAIGASRDDGTRRASAVEGTTSSVAAAPSASPECAEAVQRANASMSHAVAVSTALRQHTEIMNRLLNGKIDANTALRTGTPSLITGSAESAKFDVALADYRRVVDRCQLRAP
ncbi:MAG TPA: hypothetical protein VJ140_05825 [Actinomycetota bacterium]|nr:hypothetical protein [Actinomycetota bacterium]